MGDSVTGARGLCNLIAFDDAPFDRGSRASVPLVGVVYASLRLDGVVLGRIRQDGKNSTREIIRIVSESRFNGHINLIMLDGVAFGGFNVVDVRRLHRELERPVIVVTRKKPDMDAIRSALERRISSGRRKWQLIDALGPMERCCDCWIQRVGLDFEQASEVIRFFSVHGKIPEPVRVAHLIAGAIGRGESRGRA